MKKVALAIAATLVLAVVAPAFSQPFADVPTDHWAFDAIAELAAKGIVEGYPDGTFKGDRAMTRYEMAMVVARILARIEAIKIPAPTPAPPAPKIPAPEVTRADIQALQRLINEFRAELAALGVRVTAVEEELAAIRARLDNTRVTGFVFYRSNNNVAGPGGSGSFGLFNLTFTGRVAPSATAVLRFVGDQSVWGFTTPAAFLSVTFDRAYLDVNYLGFSWRVGLQSYSLGAIGLLFTEGIYGCACGMNGLRVTGAFGPVNFEGALFRHTGAIDLLMGRAALGLIPGWTLGVNMYSERHNFTSATPNIASNGWSVDLGGNIIPGVSLTAEYATFTPSGAAAQTAWQVNTTWNLAQLTGVTQFSPTLALWYKSWAAWSPLVPGTTDVFVIGTYATNLRAWGTTLNLTVSPQFRPYVTYESGTSTAAFVAYNELELGFRSTIAQNTTARFRYQRRSEGGVLLTHRYRLELSYSW